MFIIDDLFIVLPAKGLLGITQAIADLAEEELTDETRIKEDLLLLQTLYEMDQISDEEYEQKESELLERLTAIREFKYQ